MTSSYALQPVVIVLASLIVACTKPPSATEKLSAQMQLLGYVLSQDGRKLARLRITNETTEPIHFSGYGKSAEFQVADPFAYAYRIERGPGNWEPAAPDAGEAFEPPDKFTVLPLSSAVITVAAQEPPVFPYKICLVATDPAVEACTDILRAEGEP